MYCLPSSSKVTGPWLIPDPALNFHSSSPVLASSALNQPWILPWKTSPSLGRRELGDVIVA